MPVTVSGRDPRTQEPLSVQIDDGRIVARFAADRGELRIGASADLVRFRWDKGYSTLEIEDIFLQGNRFEPTPLQNERST